MELAEECGAELCIVGGVGGEAVLRVGTPTAFAIALAVAGMSWRRPRAPALLTAAGLKALSCRAIA